MRKKETKEKTIKMSEAKERFDRIKTLSLETSKQAILCMQEILDEFKGFVEKVKITQPNEQTLLKQISDDELDFIEERFTFLELVKGIIKEPVKEEKNED